MERFQCFSAKCWIPHTPLVSCNCFIWKCGCLAGCALKVFGCSAGHVIDFSAQFCEHLSCMCLDFKHECTYFMTIQWQVFSLKWKVSSDKQQADGGVGCKTVSGACFDFSLRTIL